jgi:alkyl sulfatase BDS1-like metallo-beta-lactamase superfamily hydrolase
VLIDPERATGMDHHVRFDFGQEKSCGVHVRNHVACPTDGTGATSVIHISPEAWADVLTGKSSLQGAVQLGQARITGDQDAVLALWGCFDIPGAR